MGYYVGVVHTVGSIARYDSFTLVLRAVFNKLVRNASPRRPMCFMCLILICQDLVGCYFYFVLLPLGPEL